MRSQARREQKAEQGMRKEERMAEAAARPPPQLEEAGESGEEGGEEGEEGEEDEEEEGEEEEGEEEGLLVRNYDRRRGGWLRRDVSLRLPPAWVGLGLARLGLGLANPN